MGNTAPAHIGDMKESVHALKVDECTKVGDVLNLSLNLVTNGNSLKELLAKLGTLGLDHFPAGDDEILAVVVNFNDFEFVDVAHVLLQVAGRNDVDL